MGPTSHRDRASSLIALAFQGGKVMFARPFAALLMIVALAAPAWAEEQRGSVEGVVRDASGAVLPGSTVEATSPTGLVQSTTADGVGVYRFPSLPPGMYKMTATLQGFQSRSV